MFRINLTELGYILLCNRAAKSPHSLTSCLTAAFHVPKGRSSFSTEINMYLHCTKGKYQSRTTILSQDSQTAKKSKNKTIKTLPFIFQVTSLPNQCFLTNLPIPIFMVVFVSQVSICISSIVSRALFYLSEIMQCQDFSLSTRS